MFQILKRKVNATKIYISNPSIRFNDQSNIIMSSFFTATLYYEPITEQKAGKLFKLLDHILIIQYITILSWIFSPSTVDSLVEIQANQALPLVQLLNHAADMELQPPESLERVVTDKGRIINGTRFTSKNFTEQLLFCPKENSRELCLVPKEFQGLEPLQCAREPQLLIREHRESKLCGPNDSGQTLDVLYEVSLNRYQPLLFNSKSSSYIILNWSFSDLSHRRS